ncbi:hypothetical protein ACET3X_000734 [Alternaria dauci]|uniref:Glycosyltransferase 2-like domain-containing protein n=1 Tax=Alternaria dauci TaxID=48095 RepID=A0ABR3UVB1_9PLEO
MITTIAFFAESLVLYVFNYTSRSNAELLSLGLLLPACAGTLFMEYRLMVPSLIASILAMLLIGAASALRKLVAKHYPGDHATRSTNAIWLVGMGSLLAFVCTVSNWPVWKQAVHRNGSRGGYDLVSRSPRAEQDDEEECGTKSQRSLRVGSQGNSLRSSLISLALVMLWTAFISFNFGQRQYPRMEPHLDLQYEPIGPLEVVISMYKESTEDVAALIAKLESMSQMSKALVTIYLKDSEADERQIKQETNAHEVIKLPNVGREAETYLNHIVNRWDSLAERTVFLQADVHNPREFYPFFERYFRANQTGFLNLGWAGILCNSDDCGDKRGWQDETSLFPDIQSRIDNSHPENVLLSYKGQFVVTAARIRGIDKSIYDDLWQLLVDENSWAHQESYLQGRPDSMSQPWFGYTTERIWNLLFQCSDMDVAWRCPTLLSGWRPGGSIADCQCFDSELVE